MSLSKVFRWQLVIALSGTLMCASASCVRQGGHGRGRSLPHTPTCNWSRTVPTNLARTDLATVQASSVNGDRLQSNCFYGVANAFDDGKTWINKINYTWWLSGPERFPWIEVTFSAPVTIVSIVVEGGPPYSARVFPVDGGEHDYPTAGEVLNLPHPLHAVTRVRLNFYRRTSETQAPVSVAEVRLLGFPPTDTHLEIRTPKVGPPRERAVIPAPAGAEDGSHERKPSSFYTSPAALIDGARSFSREVGAQPAGLTDSSRGQA